MADTLFQLTCALYILGTIGYFLCLLGRWRILEKCSDGLLLLGFLSHTIALGIRVVQAARMPATNLHEAFSFFSWCVIAIFLVLKWKYQIRAIGIILAPLASILMVFAAFHEVGITPMAPVLKSHWLIIHAGLAFLSEAIFAVAFAAGILYLIQEGRIKSKSVMVTSRHIPSLEALDHLNHLCLGIGFPLLTAGIITGAVWANLAWKSYWSWDPKQVWSLLTWCLYAVLLHQRLNVGWRGRRAAIMAIVGFALILFTFIGGNLLIPGKHTFSQMNQ